jgi:hypothetical protein
MSIVDVKQPRAPEPKPKPKEPKQEPVLQRKKGYTRTYCRCTRGECGSDRRGCKCASADHVCTSKCGCQGLCSRSLTLPIPPGPLTFVVLSESEFEERFKQLCSVVMRQKSCKAGKCKSVTGNIHNVKRKKAPIDLDSYQAEEYVIEKILDKRDVGKRREQWLVKWLHYPVSEATWEPKSKVDHFRGDDDDDDDSDDETSAVDKQHEALIQQATRKVHVMLKL